MPPPGTGYVPCALRSDSGSGRSPTAVESRKGLPVPFLFVDSREYLNTVAKVLKVKVGLPEELRLHLPAGHLLDEFLNSEFRIL